MLGRLQRGTGAGYLQALKSPRAAVRELLLACITTDPRWDRQLDTRAEYYASLAQEIGLDAAPLAAHLQQQAHVAEDWSVSLTIDTLREMGRRGDTASVAVLRDYLNWGADWENALGRLIDCGTPEALCGLDHVVCSRYPDDEDLTWQVADEEPWLTWSRSHPRLAVALQRLRAHREERGAEWSRDFYGDRPLSALFDDAARGNRAGDLRALRSRVTPQDVSTLVPYLRPEEPQLCKLALHGLGFIANEEAFAAWKRFVEEQPDLPRHVWGALIRMTNTASGTHARITGLAWFDHPDVRRQRLGEFLLERNATLADLELLRSALGVALESGDMYRLCSLANGLAAIASPAAWKELSTSFQEATYSFARSKLAKALIASSPGRFTEELASASLWDCEDAVREIACGLVNPVQSGVREKLTALAHDPHEEADIRNAAAHHLATVNP